MIAFDYCTRSTYKQLASTYSYNCTTCSRVGYDTVLMTCAPAQPNGFPRSQQMPVHFFRMTRSSLLFLPPTTEIFALLALLPFAALHLWVAFGWVFRHCRGRGRTSPFPLHLWVAFGCSFGLVVEEPAAAGLPPFPIAIESMPKFTVDQRVWVRTSETGEHEETAKVLDPQYDGEDLGLLVRLDISGYKLTFPVAQVRALEEEEEEDPTACRSSRRSRRTVITPSPKTISSTSSLKRASSLGSSITNNTTASSEEENEEESLPAEKSQNDHAQEKEKKPPAKRKKKEVDTSETEADKPAAKKKPTRAAVIALQNDSSEDEAIDDSDEDDEEEDDEHHKTFQVEYSPTGRATCRRCDATITKGSVRISHVPLFRGKPGFRVYRHVHCALFDETVHSLQDVGGWKKMQADDQQVLESRIQEARMEMEQENEEMGPDELVGFFYCLYLVVYCLLFRAVHFSPLASRLSCVGFHHHFVGATKI